MTESKSNRCVLKFNLNQLNFGELVTL